ncbi:hypothetical protein GCM10027425_15230 [Alteromonas gracilis]
MTTHIDTPGHSGPQLSRRTLARGAAWSVPVVAATAAAPAYAASPCSLAPQTVSTTTDGTASPTRGYTRNTTVSPPTATWRTQDPDGALPTYGPVIATISTTLAPEATNLTIGFSSTILNLQLFPNTPGTGLPSLSQRPTVINPTPGPTVRGYANRQITRFQFNRTVRNLRFNLNDISQLQTTSTSCQFWDSVWIETDGTFSVANAEWIGGDGKSPATPLEPNNPGLNLSDTDPRWDNSVVTFTGTCTYFTLHYWSRQFNDKTVTATGGQGINLSNLTMEVGALGC